MEFKAKSTAWIGCNLWENNEIELFDLTTKAPRVDGVTKAMYGERLEDNL